MKLSNSFSVNRSSIPLFSPPSRNQSRRHRTQFPSANLFDGFLEDVRKNIQSGFSSLNPESNNEFEGQQDHEGTFVPLDPDSTGSIDGSRETTFGPLSILACGFLAHEFKALQELLEGMGAEEVSLIPSTPELMEMRLGQALAMNPPPPHHHPPPELSENKVLFLSGMYASEVIEIVGAVRDSEDVPDCAFAAAVPNSINRQVSELVADVRADHAAMTAEKDRRRRIQEQSFSEEE